MADAAAAKDELKTLVESAGRQETNKLCRTVGRWWNEIEVLIGTGATSRKVDVDNTAIKNIKRIACGYHNAANYKSVILFGKCLPDGGMMLSPVIPFRANRENPLLAGRIRRAVIPRVGRAESDTVSHGIKRPSP